MIPHLTEDARNLLINTSISMANDLDRSRNTVVPAKNTAFEVNFDHIVI